MIRLHFSVLRQSVVENIMSRTKEVETTGLDWSPLGWAYGLIYCLEAPQDREQWAVYRMESSHQAQRAVIIQYSYNQMFAVYSTVCEVR